MIRKMFLWLSWWWRMDYAITCLQSIYSRSREASSSLPHQKKTTCPTSSSFRMCRSFKNKPSIRSLSRFSFYEKIWRTFSILLCTCEEYIVRVKLYYLTVVISKYVFLSILSFFADNLHIMMTGSPLQSLLYASLLWLDSLLGI